MYVKKLHQYGGQIDIIDHMTREKNYHPLQKCVDSFKNTVI